MCLVNCVGTDIMCPWWSAVICEGGYASCNYWFCFECSSCPAIDSSANPGLIYTVVQLPSYRRCPMIAQEKIQDINDITIKTESNEIYCSTAGVVSGGEATHTDKRVYLSRDFVGRTQTVSVLDCFAFTFASQNSWLRFAPDELNTIILIFITTAAWFSLLLSQPPWRTQWPSGVDQPAMWLPEGEAFQAQSAFQMGS